MSVNLLALRNVWRRAFVALSGNIFTYVFVLYSFNLNASCYRDSKQKDTGVFKLKDFSVTLNAVKGLCEEVSKGPSAYKPENISPKLCSAWYSAVLTAESRLGIASEVKEYAKANNSLEVFLSLCCSY